MEQKYDDILGLYEKYFFYLQPNGSLLPSNYQKTITKQINL